MARSAGPLIGIDLGTTNSVVAYIDPAGRPTCVPNSEGDILTPSVVYFEESGPAIVGREAAKAGLDDPSNFADLVKRDMGKPAFHRPIRGKSLPPAAIAGVILHRLLEDTQARLGKFTRAVVTVPAYFNEPRRRATLEAARMAGLTDVELLNEPTAAALAFGFQAGVFTGTGELANIETRVPGQCTLLVYDLGGGTFDATLMRIKDRHFQAVVCDGDVMLGGRDWDERVVRYAIDCFQREFQLNLRESPTDVQLLWKNAEETKRSLTQRAKADFRIDHAQHRLTIELSRQDLLYLTRDLLGRTRLTCELVMQEAKMEWDQLDSVLLVGGSSRMPMVHEMLRELTGREPSRAVSPDEAVAQGAALYAQMLWGEEAAGRLHDQVRRQGARITNINSHSLGIVARVKGTSERRVSVLIPKNTPIPHSNSKTFRTRGQGQPRIYMRVVEGESSDPDECALIGECRLLGLPPELPAGSDVLVTFAYRRDGRIFVEAQVENSAPFQVEIDRNQQISEEEAELWANELIGDDSATDEATRTAPSAPPSMIKVQRASRPAPKPTTRPPSTDDDGSA